MDKMYKDISLPLNRVRTIMKSSLETGQINNEVLLLMTKTTEMFVSYLTKEAYAHSNGNTLLYKHLASTVLENKYLEFLLQIVPQRITVHNFKKILNDSTLSDSDNEDIHIR